MKYFVEFVVRALVDFPDEVDIQEVDGGDSLTYYIRLNPQDIGKVIGRNGRTISAIRNIVHAAATKVEKRVQVEILEEGAEPAS
jgi:predicted RNA-binding protein YlqC (UPF0109 family)